MRLVFAGGGSGGHIIPNLTIINGLKKESKSHEILYIGRRSGLEKELTAKLGVDYKGIFCGKLRRYFSWENVLDLFKVPVGIFQSLGILLQFHPDLIFCKGGYVSLPVTIAGWLLRIPVIIHESDVHPGLSNRISSVFAKVVCISFEATRKYFPKNEVQLTGIPISPNLLDGNVRNAMEFTGFKNNLPVVLFMSGSQGDDFMNEIAWTLLPKLLPSYQVLHLCGENKIKSFDKIKNAPLNYGNRYKAYEFLEKEMKDLYALSDLVITRSGANTLAELAALNKPAILIPLTKNCSRGEQMENAKQFIKAHQADLLDEDSQRKAFLKKLEELVLIKYPPLLKVNKKNPLKMMIRDEATCKIIDLLFSFEERSKIT